ncbi:MAG: sigma-70 family RNA polymerase sigma factor [Lachnospiraceae bacterium]|nr:sigma-70 family RNA polymerase sigma factor [Lachnospiraceae bacterium]
MDKELFLKKYEEVYRDMYRYALMTLGHRQDAEDTVSDAVCDAYRQRESLNDPEAFRGWIFRILSRKCIGKKRDYATKKTVSLDVPKEDEDNDTSVIDNMPDDSSPCTEGHTIMCMMLRALDEDDRRIILLHIFGGYTSAEIGDIMGMNDATVRSREHRALKKLREDFTP